MWSTASGLPLTPSLLHRQGVRNVAFKADGNRLVTLDFRGLRVWDVATGQPLTVLLEQTMHGGTGFQSASTRFHVTSDGRYGFFGLR